MTKTIRISDISGKPATHTISWERDTDRSDPMGDTITETVTYDLTCEEVDKILAHLVAPAYLSNQDIVEHIIERLQKAKSSQQNCVLAQNGLEDADREERGEEVKYATVDEFRAAIDALGKGNEAWARAWVSCVDRDRKVSQHDTAIGVLESLIEKHSVFLGMDDDYNLDPAINLSDTFWYACADCESFGAFDVFWLDHLSRVLPSGDIVWVARKRGLAPIPPILNSPEYQHALNRYDDEWANFVAALESATDAMEILEP